jgi:hypothetical protein
MGVTEHVYSPDFTRSPEQTISARATRKKKTISYTQRKISGGAENRLQNVKRLRIGLHRSVGKFKDAKLTNVRRGSEYRKYINHLDNRMTALDKSISFTHMNTLSSLA